MFRLLTVISMQVTFTAQQIRFRQEFTRLLVGQCFSAVVLRTITGQRNECTTLLYFLSQFLGCRQYS